MENRYLHAQYDQDMRDLWQKQQVYRHHNASFKPFTIDTPPPTVSGLLHIGHIFSYTQTDLIARFKRMTGHNVFYPFGFDCNGLATERFVEKKHNTNVSKLGREKFIDLCLSTTEDIKGKFVHLWQMMGLSAELEKTYSTISPQVQKIAQESFIDLVKNDYAYVKKEPALYCVQCRTTVAQAELDDVSVPSNFYHILFKTTDNQSVTIATTRPELLPACVAVFYNPHDARYAHLKNIKIRTPIFNQEVPFIADEHVVVDKGTGLVMCCTFGDKVDIEWFKKYQLPYIQAIGFDGKMSPQSGALAGLSIADARKKIIELLQEEGLIVESRAIEHTVNVHERCKTPIEYAILSQWFIKVVDNASHFLKMADQVNWYPSYMKTRFVDWVKNLSWDWCISRQRVFGIPFPVWYCNACNAIVLADVADLPIDPQMTHYHKSCDACGSTSFRPEKDVMDTWNTSSLTPFICKDLYQDHQGPVFDKNNFLPMSMRPQAHDIIRTWAFYTIVKSWMHTKNIPWTDIVISGYVLSENKEKISKSKDNAPTDPEKLLTQFAPDAIRFWTACGTLGQDTAFSVEQITIGQKLMNKMWNAFKFIDLNAKQFASLPHNSEHMDLINQWIMQQSLQALYDYRVAFEKNEFSGALSVIEKLFWHDFCDNYLEIIKDKFFNPTKYDQADIAATIFALRSVGFHILQMYAPFMPHITEYLYQYIFKHDKNMISLHLTQFECGAMADQNIAYQMNLVLNLIAKVRKIKTQAQLSLKTEIAQLYVAGLQNSDELILKNNAKIIQGVCKVQHIHFTQHERGESFDSEDISKVSIYVDFC